MGGGAVQEVFVEVVVDLIPPVAQVALMVAAQVLGMQTEVKAQFVLFGRETLGHSHQLA
jgi:hypothetical protein